MKDNIIQFLLHFPNVSLNYFMESVFCRSGIEIIAHICMRVQESTLCKGLLPQMCGMARAQ